ncbi:MAG: hypothetical protein WC378_15405 [Opitutaceae bacterium]|jgi:hypothetical protein
MSFTVNVTLARDEASRDVAIVHDLLASPEQRTALMKVVGLRAEQELKSWFIRRDAENPNKMGWPRQHFWSRIAKRTAFDPSKTTEHSTTVVVSDPALAAKVNGPTTIHATGAVSPVTGKPTQNLAIPMQGAVYGAWPRGNPVPGLFFIRSKTGVGGFLVTRDADGKGLNFFYRLVPEVTVPKDPQALPPMAELGAALGATAQAYFRRHGTGGNS